MILLIALEKVLYEFLTPQLWGQNELKPITSVFAKTVQLSMRSCIGFVIYVVLKDFLSGWRNNSVKIEILYKNLQSKNQIATNSEHSIAAIPAETFLFQSDFIIFRTVKKQKKERSFIVLSIPM